jgi:hypothetical protein
MCQPVTRTNAEKTGAAEFHVLENIGEKAVIWTLKIELLSGAYFKGHWEGLIEISSTSTLEDLHFAIIAAVNFDNDHMYEFFISRTERSRNGIRFDNENEATYNTTLESLYPLENKKTLFYMFDYGDNWLFKITKTRKKAKAVIEGVKYPFLIVEKGEKPIQYPNWEE